MARDIVLIHGSYYRKNFGDYLLIKRLVNEFEPGNVRLPFASQQVLNEFKDIKKMKWSELLSVKQCVYGGGGYLGEPPEGVDRWSIGFVKRHFIPFVILKVFCVPVKIIGAGLGPISSLWLKPIVRFMLEKAETVKLRDEESINYALNITDKVKYELVTDLAQDKAFLESEIVAKLPADFPAKYIALHIGAHLSNNIESYLVEKIKKSVLSGFSIVYFSDSPGHNQNLKNSNFFLNEILNIQGIIIKKVYYESASEVLSIINNASGVITGKLHTGIVACTFDTPVLSIPLHHKTKRYYKHIGHEDFCLNSQDDTDVNHKKIDVFFESVNSSKEKVLSDVIKERHTNAIKAVHS